MLMAPARRAGASGFTLVEILIVIAVIGVIVTLATLSFGNDRASNIQREARQLASRIELARDEAVISSQAIGIRFESDRYHFLQQVPPDSGAAWAPTQGDRLFREYEMPDYMELRFEVAEGSVGDGEETVDAIVWSTGLVTPFEVVLADKYQREGAAWRVAVSPGGRITSEPSKK